MTLSLASPSIAILVANGFDENHITAVQRSMTKEKMTYKMIAPEQGLVNGWQDSTWGHYFTVDESISTAMGSDYDLLVLVGGERGVAKLKTNLHTRRIINHFLEAGKPVAAIGSGVDLLTLSPKSAGLSVSGFSGAAEELQAAQMVVSEEDVCVDGAVLTAKDSQIEGWLSALMGQVAQAQLAQKNEDEAVAA
ncbi:MAG: DJ-1/PfpI family protein [Bdellovibrionales bacterium]|jgi:protease I